MQCGRYSPALHTKCIIPEGLRAPGNSKIIAAGTCEHNCGRHRQDQRIFRKSGFDSHFSNVIHPRSRGHQSIFLSRPDNLGRRSIRHLVRHILHARIASVPSRWNTYSDRLSLQQMVNKDKRTCRPFHLLSHLPSCSRSISRYQLSFFLQIICSGRTYCHQSVDACHLAFEICHPCRNFPYAPSRHLRSHQELLHVETWGILLAEGRSWSG